MSALTSLLARDRAVPVHEIEEALKRQVVSGGDLGTLLLEANAVSENTLAAYQAATFALLPATRDEVMRVARDAIRLVPREVAEQHRFVPIAVDGRVLVVAAAAPLDARVESELGFLLGYELVVRVVCEIRVVAALMHHYGVDADARSKRLIESLRHRDAGRVPFVTPPESTKLSSLQRASVPRKTSASAWLDEPDEPDPPKEPARPISAPPPSFEGRSTDPMGVHATVVQAALEERAARAPLPREPASTDPSAAAEPAVAASLSDLAVSASWSRPPEEVIERRVTSSYARAEGRPKPSARAVPPRDAREGAEREPAASSLEAADPEAASREGEVDRAAVAPILGVGVRRSSFPPPSEERRSIVEPILEAHDTVEIDTAPVIEAVRGGLHLPPPPRAPIVTPASPIAAQVVEPAPEARPRASESATSARRPKLHGPITPAQAGKLLDDADERDAIVDVFFAFARQFFDYAALFTISGDRAEGRDAFGDGTPAHQLQSIALTIEPEEGSLLASVRRAALPRVGRLSSAADIDLATVLGRPRDIVALAYPIVIRGRTVLAFYGDRGGDAFDLSDLPELVGFAHRVSDALEKLILRRKRGGFGRSEEAGRAGLKATLGAVRRSVPPPASSSHRGARREDRWSSSRLEAAPAAQPSGPTLADALARAELARSTEDEALEAPSERIETAGSPSPEPRVAARRQTFREVLGIPRAAPPPPAAPDLFDGSEAEDDEDEEGELGSGAAQGAAADDGPELVIEESSDPELSIDEPDEEDEPLDDTSAAGPSYLLRDASVEVLSPRGAPRASSARPSTGESMRGIGAVAKSAILEPSHREGARPTHDREVPSIIVDMGDGAQPLVDELLRSTRESSGSIVERLVALGESALPALAQAFPGPIWLDPRRGRVMPDAHELSAVARALLAFRDRAAPYVASLVGDAASEHRLLALIVASEIPSASLVGPVVERVFDADERVRRAALELLPRLRAFVEMRDQLGAIRRAARVRGKVLERRLHALAALAALRDIGSLDDLLDMLDDEDDEVRRASHQALVAITCEDLGTSARRWEGWLEKNRERHRVEWLIDALQHEDESIRAQAGAELQALTQQYFGYHAALARKERDIVRAKYRRWWEHEGRARFGRL